MQITEQPGRHAAPREPSLRTDPFWMSNRWLRAHGFRLFPKHRPTGAHRASEEEQ